VTSRERRQEFKQEKPFDKFVEGLFASKVAGAGFEVPLENERKTALRGQSGAEPGALDASDCMVDPELAEVVKSWSTLHRAVKTAILAMIQVNG
jgi:hypothetical protein